MGGWHEELVVPVHEVFERLAAVSNPSQRGIEIPCCLFRNVPALAEPSGGASGQNAENRQRKQDDEYRDSRPDRTTFFLALFAHAPNSTRPRMKKPQHHGLGGFGAGAEESGQSSRTLC